MQETVLSVRVYAFVLAALLLLLAATVLIGLLEGSAIGPSLGLAIAAAKATLIVLFFMHVRYESAVIRLAAAAGFLWLAILIGLSLSDILSRHWSPQSEFSSSDFSHHLLINNTSNAS